MISSIVADAVFGGVVLAGEPAEKGAGRHRAVLDDVLAHGGEPEHDGDLVIVDADQRDVAGDVEVELAGGDHGAERHLVGEGEDRRRPVVAAEQREGGLVPTLDGEVDPAR